MANIDQNMLGGMQPGMQQVVYMEREQAANDPSMLADRGAPNNFPPSAQSGIETSLSLGLPVQSFTAAPSVQVAYAAPQPRLMAHYGFPGRTPAQLAAGNAFERIERHDLQRAAIAAAGLANEVRNESAAINSALDSIYSMGMAQSDETRAQLAAKVATTLENGAGGDRLYTLKQDMQVAPGKVYPAGTPLSPKEMAAALLEATDASPEVQDAVIKRMSPSRPIDISTTKPDEPKHEPKSKPAPHSDTPQDAPKVAAGASITIPDAGNVPAKHYKGADGKDFDHAKAPKVDAAQVKAIQAMVGAKEDGKWGPETQEKFEKAAKAAGFEDPSKVDFTNKEAAQKFAAATKQQTHAASKQAPAVGRGQPEATVDAQKAAANAAHAANNKGHSIGYSIEIAGKSHDVVVKSGMSSATHEQEGALYKMTKALADPKAANSDRIQAVKEARAAGIPVENVTYSVDGQAARVSAQVAELEKRTGVSTQIPATKQPATGTPPKEASVAAPAAATNISHGSLNFDKTTIEWKSTDPNLTVQTREQVSTMLMNVSDSTVAPNYQMAAIEKARNAGVDVSKMSYRVNGGPEINIAEREKEIQQGIAKVNTQAAPAPAAHVQAAPATAPNGADATQAQDAQKAQDILKGAMGEIERQRNAEAAVRASAPASSGPTTTAEEFVKSGAKINIHPEESPENLRAQARALELLKLQVEQNGAAAHATALGSIAAQLEAAARTRGSQHSIVAPREPAPVQQGPRQSPVIDLNAPSPATVTPPAAPVQSAPVEVPAARPRVIAQAAPPSGVFKYAVESAGFVSGQAAPQQQAAVDVNLQRAHEHYKNTEVAPKEGPGNVPMAEGFVKKGVHQVLSA
ncbi:MAG: hypothetical protein ACOYNL_07470 [Rickettsiales bacterium]